MTPRARRPGPRSDVGARPRAAAEPDEGRRERISAITLGKRLDAPWEGADVLAVGVAGRANGPARDPDPQRSPSGGAPDAAARLAAERYGVDLDAVLSAERVTGRAGEVVRVPVQSPAGLPARLLLVGTGTGSAAEARRAGASLARAVRGRDLVLTSLADSAPGEVVQALVEGLVLGGWTPPAIGTKRRTDTLAARAIQLLGEVAADRVGTGSLHAGATALVRDLAATPSNVKNPPWLAEQAAQLGDRSGLEVRVWDEAALAEAGFGGLLAVGGGSSTPPRLVQLDYTPTSPVAGRGVVLVGKGITYDTGGLSIKSREAMVPMKTDMAGAAAVLATVAACRSAGVRRRVTGLLAIAENAVGGSSYRPGDVVRHYGGRTVEVTNTDAEGRLVLADALAFAVETLDPEILIDLATLTGAATLGLGRRHAALFTPDDRLAADLTAAGAAAGENVWRLPLVEDYRGVLDSSVADLRHVASHGRTGAGSIVAALFLREFTDGRRWAHLDIAGTARSDKDEYEITRGPTGYGARLLLRWLQTLR